jgi:hypothetical protein
MQACDYYKAIPKELDSFFTGYKPYSERTHFEQSKIFNTETKDAMQQLNTDIQEMKYSDCKNMCNPNGNCMIECLSFGHSFNILTHYYYTITENGEDSCTFEHMDDFFKILKKKCEYIRNNSGNYFIFKSDGKELTYNFRLGYFETSDYNDVEIYIQKMDEVYKINVPLIINGFVIDIPKTDYYCINAIGVIEEDKKEKGAKCNINNIYSTNKGFHQNLRNTNFVKSFDYDFTSLNLFEINKKFVHLKATYENNNSISYYFTFDANKYYDLFLTLVDALRCANNKNNFRYHFLFRNGEYNYSLYELDFKTMEMIEYGSSSWEKPFIFKNLKVVKITWLSFKLVILMKK